MLRRPITWLVQVMIAMLLVASTAAVASAHDTAVCHHSTSTPPEYEGQWWVHFDRHWTTAYGHYHEYSHYIWYDWQGWGYVHNEVNVCGGGTLVAPAGADFHVT